jgi:hypothetical protein
MKKRVLTIVAALALAITPAVAQVFIDEDEMNENRGTMATGGFGAMVPQQDVFFDQYIPVGDGLLLLGGLGITYLLGKRKKDE